MHASIIIICNLKFQCNHWSNHMQVDRLGSLLDDVKEVEDVMEEFGKLLKSYNIK